MNTVTQTMKFRQSLLSYAEKHEVTQAAIKYNVNLRQFLDGFDADFLFRLGRCFITVTHGATSVAAISDDDRTIQFLFVIVIHFLIPLSLFFIYKLS